MDFGRIAAGVVTLGGSELLRGANGLLTGDAPPDPESMYKPVDQNLIDQRNQIHQNADQFNSNLGDYKQGQINQAGEGARTQLASGINAVNTQANSRGLLYSGLRSGQEASMRAGSANNVAEQAAGINRRADQQNMQMRQQDVQAGMGLQGIQEDRARNVYNTGLKQQEQRGGLLKGIGAAAGSGLGAAAAKSEQNQPKQNTRVSDPYQTTKMNQASNNSDYSGYA